jgi:hypothetical protein
MADSVTPSGTSSYLDDCSVTIEQRFQHESLEEIRLQDYKAGRYGNTFSTYAAADMSWVNDNIIYPLPQPRFKPNMTAA